MSKAYDEFKAETLAASRTIDHAKGMQAVSADFADGFNKAMWEAREIYLRVEDKAEERNQSDE